MTPPMVFGRAGTTEGIYYDGFMDEVRMWNDAIPVGLYKLNPVYPYLERRLVSTLELYP
jgi:hypothetical protein